MATSQVLLQQQCGAVTFELQIENVILKQKNNYLNDLSDEYRDKFQQLSANEYWNTNYQRRYIHPRNQYVTNNIDIERK